VLLLVLPVIACAGSAPPKRSGALAVGPPAVHHDPESEPASGAESPPHVTAPAPPHATAPAPPTSTTTPDEHRDVVAFCERYRAALEARDAGALLALASPSYLDRAGTDDAADDVDHRGLRAHLSRTLSGVQDVRFEIRYQRITREPGRVVVDIRISASFVIRGRSLQRVSDGQLVLEPHAGSFRILSGM
jgi:hypothetical protein